MSLVPETWKVVKKRRGVRVITRVKHSTPEKFTSWRLVKIEGQWRVSHIFFSKINPGLDRNPNQLKTYRTPFRLSDSRIDHQLRTLAETA